MKEFSNPMEKREPDPILSKEDSEVLEFGLHALVDLLEKKNVDDLPSVVVFLETAARPLYYATQPIIKEIYKGKKELPKFHFLSVMREPEKHNVPPEADLKKVELIREEIKNLNEIEFSWGHGLDDYYKNVENKKLVGRSTMEKRLEYAAETGWTQALKNRFSEILKNSNAGNVLFIDDFLARGDTVNQIEKSLGDMLPSGRKSEYFIFYSDGTSILEDRDIPISVGLSEHEIPYKELSVLFKGWSFTHRATTPWEIQKKASSHLKSEVIGVEKPNYPHETVTRAKDANPEKMEQLRREMESIALRVLKNPNFNRRKELDKLDNLLID